MRELLQLLEYTFWANDLFIERLKEQSDLSAEIQKELSHILRAHRIWLERIGGRGTLPSVWDTINQASWEGINIELYNESCDLVKSQDLETSFHFTTTQGKVFEQTLGDTLFHIINHSTHHRARVALLMRNSKILPPQSDYIFYLRSR